MMRKDNRHNIVRFEHLDIDYDRDSDALWAVMKYSGRPCMSLPLLDDFKQAQNIIANVMQPEHSTKPVKYLVLSSELPGVFNLGGDLAYFVQLIRERNRDALHDYAKACIDMLYQSMCGGDMPFTTIALVQGETLGGGFEAALSANVLIAERSAKFGFPETVFGMFPGMGAYNFLTRRLSPGLAKRIIASGKVYGATELFEMGVIDEVVPDGRGEEAVAEFIRHQQSRSLGFKALDRIVDHFNPIAYRELYDVIEIWVDTAMQLSDKNIRLMEYLVHAQEKRWCAQPAIQEESLMAG
ncbi:MAG: crotonase/enoyl-CoA hydratase family protein [Chromatiales bacterium]|nr:crotonase/enoyl-CoA hydratase family protein [Chromatiales bacterium]